MHPVSENPVSENPAADTPLSEPASETQEFVLPLLAEELDVTRRQTRTARITVSTVTTEREALVDELLTNEHADIERVEIRQLVDEMPQVREEGDILIIPVVEEVVVVERRLFLKEEVRIRRVRTTHRHQETVVLREQSLSLNRQPSEPTPAGAAPRDDRPAEKDIIHGQ